MTLGLLLWLALTPLPPAEQDEQETERFESFFREGLELSQQGKDIDALRALQEAATLRPDHANLQFALGSLLARNGRSAEALQAFQKAVAIDPDDIAFQFALGEALYRAGDYEAAKSTLEKAAAPPEPLPEALVILAGIYEKQNELEGVLETLRRYLDIRPEDQAMRQLLGQQLLGAKRYDEAIEVWKGGLTAEERPVDFLVSIGETLALSRETYEEAEAHLKEVLEKDPKHLRAALELAKILRRTEREAEALELLEQAEVDHPDSSELQYSLATLYQRLRRTDEAKVAGKRFQELSSLEKRLEEEEARVPVTYKRGLDLLQQGQLLQAEGVFESVLEIDPENAPARAMLAKIAFSKGYLAAAKRWIGEALEINPIAGEYLYLSGLFAIKEGNLAGAETRVRRSLELGPGFPDAWMLLGTILLDSRRAGEAIECFLKAAALEPSNPMAQLNLATAYAALGKKQEEEDALRRYRKLSEQR